MRFMNTYVKYSLFLLVCLISSYESSANAIDSIKTKEDVINFLHANLENDFKNYGINRVFLQKNEELEIDSNISKQLAAHEKRRYRSDSFYKVDIDNNGRTDLVLDGEQVYIVMDMGNKYVLNTIVGYVYNPAYSFKEAIRLPDHSKALLFRNDRWEKYGRNVKTISRIDTIVYKFNSFIEYREHPAYANIKKIDYYEQPSSESDGSSFNMEININGNAIYEQHSGGIDQNNIFFGFFDSIQLGELWNLLRYMDVRLLNNSYSISVTDQATALIAIYFDDGSVKKISDYGFCGTIGLSSLYNKIFELKKSKIWQLWYTAPPKIDTYLIEWPILFPQYAFEGFCYCKRNIKKSDVTNQVFVSTEQFC